LRIASLFRSFFLASSEKKASFIHWQRRQRPKLHSVNSEEVIINEKRAMEENAKPSVANFIFFFALHFSVSLRQ